LYILNAGATNDNSIKRGVRPLSSFKKEKKPVSTDQ